MAVHVVTGCEDEHRQIVDRVPQKTLPQNRLFGSLSQKHPLEHTVLATSRSSIEISVRPLKRRAWHHFERFDWVCHRGQK